MKLLATGIAMILYIVSGVVSANPGGGDEVESHSEVVVLGGFSVVRTFELTPNQRFNEMRYLVNEDMVQGSINFKTVATNTGKARIRVSVNYVRYIWTGVKWFRYKPHEESVWLNPGEEWTLSRKEKPMNNSHSREFIQVRLSSELASTWFGLRKRYRKGAEGSVVFTCIEAKAR